MHHLTLHEITSSATVFSTFAASWAKQISVLFKIVLNHTSDWLQWAYCCKLWLPGAKAVHFQGAAVKRYFVSTVLATRTTVVSEGLLPFVQVDFAGASRSACPTPLPKAAALGRNYSMGDTATLQEHSLILIYQATNWSNGALLVPLSDHCSRDKKFEWLEWTWLEWMREVP